MNKLTLLIPLLLIIVGCTKEIPHEKLQDRGGTFYEVNATTPFTGATVRYHDNGQLETRLHFKDGKRHGTDYGYYENEVSAGVENWKNGKRHGIWDEFNKDTTFKRRIVYKENEQITVKLAGMGEIPITPGEEGMMRDPNSYTFDELMKQLVAPDE